MKVLLIYPKTKIWQSVTQMPLGLAYLGAVLEKAGLQVEIFDTTVEDIPLGQRLRENHFDLVGISANTSLIKGAWEIAALVKKHSNAVVVLGGPHPSALPEESLIKPSVDLIIRGEGEETILEVCQAISKKRSFEDILGISYKKNGMIFHNLPRPLNKDLDKLPFPAYHLFKLGKYTLTQPLRDKVSKSSRAFYIMTSRGCPYGCVYCFKGIYGRTWRARSPENVVAEWRYLVKKLGATEIGVQDDVINLDRKRIIEICNLLIKERLNHIPWITNNGIRADKVDLEVLKKMKMAGCKRVAFGVESGSQEILNNIQKHLKLEEIKTAFRLAKKVELETIGFFMFGNPGENEKTMEKTIRFALELDPDIVLFSIATPFPGTPLYNKILLEGTLLNKNWDDFGNLEGKGLFKLKEVTPDLVEKKWREAYRRFYLRPARVWRELRRKENWPNLKPLLKAGVHYFFR